MTALHCIGGRVAQAGAAMAAAWPLATRAQHHVPVIGFLSAGSAAGRDDLINGFRRGLSEAGMWKVGTLRLNSPRVTIPVC
jgi:hypothetical protein